MTYHPVHDPVISAIGYCGQSFEMQYRYIQAVALYKEEGKEYPVPYYEDLEEEIAFYIGSY